MNQVWGDDDKKKKDRAKVSSKQELPKQFAFTKTKQLGMGCDYEKTPWALWTTSWNGICPVDSLGDRVVGSTQREGEGREH